jgi:hypothetical protein
MASPAALIRALAVFLKLMTDTPYTREEVIAAGDSFPERGLLCERCKTKIPQFQDLSEHGESRIRQMIHGIHPMTAMTELRKVMDCSLRWAKIWVIHEGRPKPLENKTAPCPYCEMPLRTSLAKQCRYCNRDWHDAENVITLGDG